MEERLKKNFWIDQRKMELYKKNKFKYNLKAFIMTLFPSYIAYYHFYENQIRRFSFVVQFIVIFNLYKIFKSSLLRMDIEKENQPSFDEIIEDKI